MMTPNNSHNDSQIKSLTGIQYVSQNRSKIMREKISAPIGAQIGAKWKGNI